MFKRHVERHGEATILASDCECSCGVNKNLSKFFLSTGP